MQQYSAVCKPKQEIHVILDNLSAHKTEKVASFLQEHQNVMLHFTPTYSSEREVIARGIFSSVRDLSRKVICYIRSYSKNGRTPTDAFIRCPISST